MPRSSWPYLLLLLAAALGCGPSEVEKNAALMTGGDPARGSALVRQYGCNACHTIPGVREAQGQVGPPLAGIALRVYLAGQLPNTPENLIRWIRVPQEVERGTAMPNLGVTEQDARDLAAFLMTLR